ncbi:MAG: NAD(P)/FAD-dependent oxidoreductase [Spirochaetales bacterium]|nr:MAG: NAD(P)/FAD-dependent oxidoreductase [Spirochaetales bacterium]
MEKNYDAIVIGAGVGGLSTATLLAKEGRKVLLLERTDRVGGRAMSIKGEEISDKGLKWYKDLLATQYTYIAGSVPEEDAIVRNRMLDGYTLDIGYHAISANGAGYMLDFEDLIGGIEGVNKHGAHWGSYYKGTIYRDVAGNYIDPNLRMMAKEEKIPYLDFYIDAYKLTDKEIDELEKVSFREWAEKKGITRNEVIYNHLHTVGTLFSTINNPDDISIGDIFRYFKHAFEPKLARGVLGWVGGFVENGTMEWSKAVAKKFQSLGGELMLNAKVSEIMVEKGVVTGVRAKSEDGGEVEFSADIVVSNIPAQQTFKIINKNLFPREWVDKIQSMYGYGSYVPYIGLNRLPMPEEHAKLGIKNTCVLPRSEGFDWDVYICWNIQSVIDSSVAPAGKYLYTAYLPISEKESLDRSLVGKTGKTAPRLHGGDIPGFQGVH